MLFNTTGEAWGHYAKWNKPFRKTNMAWFHLYEVSKVVKFVSKSEWNGSCQVFRKATIAAVQSFSHVWLFATQGLQHNSLPCLSPSPMACSNSCPSSLWCHPTISSFVVPFSSCLQSFPASESFPMSWLFASGGQISGVSASASDLPMNIQDWFPLGFTGLISCSTMDSQESSPTPQFKSISSSKCSAFFIVQLSYPYMTIGKTRDLTRQNFVGKVMSLLFNTPSLS